MHRLPIPSRILTLFRHSLRGLRRKPPPVAEPGQPSLVSFRCNLCGVECRVPASAISRETPSCDHCGSTVRLRAIVHLLTTELFGRSIALPDLNQHHDIVGIGLSDAACYAQPLSRKLDYTNTYFDGEPHLDIANVPDDRIALYDFIIASDVFEHVAPPVSRAFRNTRRLLKPGGVFIFTVPFTLEAETLEHFPLLHDYRVRKIGAGWQLENRTADGQVQIFSDLIFHDGPGMTLEMRQFSRAALEREFEAAGFSRWRVADEAFPAHGIAWPEPWAVPMVAHA